MKCQNCGVDVPEDKIYCERCGTAIQMVPDYNPEEDISIGKEEQKKTQTTEETEDNTKRSKWCYAIAGFCVLLLGGFITQGVYRSLHTQETITEPIEPVLLAKPQFSIEPGEYDYSPMLSISHPEQSQGTIYYTTDGTTPNENSYMFHSPIEIREGRTILRAIFVRFDGIQSEEADGTYDVIFDYPEEPESDIPGGNYSKGLYVTITAEEDCKIYYTTNGEEPDYQSHLYRGRIYIPVGLTVLQAVAIDEEGGVSAITEAIYNVSENFTIDNESMEHVE